VLSGFHRGVNEICALQGIYAEWIDSVLPMFRNNLSVPSSRVKQSNFLGAWPSKMGPMGCSETSVTNCQSTLS